MNDDELRRGYQAGMRDTPADDPVTEEELLALVERRGDEATRLAILDRVMASETGRREFELLRAAAAAARGVRPAPAAARRWVIPLLAAAALALVAVTLTLTRRDPEPRFRGGNGEAVALSAPWDGAEVPGSAGTRFAWRPVPRATRYRVEVLDPDRTVMFTAETADTEAVTDRALPAGAYLWRVEALLRDGSLRQSPVRRLTVPAGGE